jgi:class 3 adenylate cyclase/predicted ATPase
MTFDDILEQAIEMLRRRGRLTYRALRRQFDLDDEYLDDLKEELIKGQQLAVDEDGEVLVWTGDTESAPSPASVSASVQVPDQKRSPISYTPQHLTEKILTSRSALEGERKQVTVCFADIKDSTELIKDLDPEAAQQLLDPAIHIMMEAVHRYEGTVNQVLGDGIMALFGAPIAHEDHALRACYAALAMQAAMQPYADEVLRSHGMAMRIRVGLNSGEVVVRTIGNDLHMDYSAVGQTTNLASRMEQLAAPGSITLTGGTLRLVEGLVQVNARGPVPVKGMTEPVEVYELTGASSIRRRLQAAVARGLTTFVGRDTEIETLHQALEQAEAGHGQVAAAVGEAGVGKSRLVYEFIHSHRTQGWLVLESASVSYGKATPYFPVVDLLKRYVHVEDGDEPRTIRAKVTGQVLTLDETLQETIPALLSLLDALSEDSSFLQLDPPQRRQRTLDGLKRILLRESQVQPLLLVFEDLHWIDSETQALLDNLVESLPTAQLLLLVNYRPEYNHGWGSKTYYTQLRLDPLPPESADAFLQALLGDDPSLEPLKKLLIERTEGNPFFLEESVRTLVETQVLIGEPGAYRLAHELPTIQVPATVQAILAARIDRLPQEEKRLLQTAAVIGTEVPFTLLQAITEVSEEALYRGLTHLQAAEFLYETSLFPERVYTFKHALTQQVAYQSLLMSTRQQIHQRVAENLKTTFPELTAAQPELVAHHYMEAGCHAQAVGFWYQAGSLASQQSAHVEAIAHLTQGLEALQGLPETNERHRQELDLQLALGRGLMVTRGFGAADAEHAYTRVRELCQRVEALSQQIAALAGLRRMASGRGDIQTARDLSEQLLEFAQRQPDTHLLLEAYYSLGTTLQQLGEVGTARTQFEQGITLDKHLALNAPTVLQRVGIDPSVGIRTHAGRTLWTLGYPEQAVQRDREALTLAEQRAHPYSQVFALFWSATLYAYLREDQISQRQAEAGIALATPHEFEAYLVWGTVLCGWARGIQGNYEEGVAQIQQGLSSWQSLGTVTYRAYGLYLLAEIYGHAGQPEEGLRAIATALTTMETGGDQHCKAEVYRLQGELLVQGGQGQKWDEAEKSFGQALALARHQHAKSWELRAATSLARLWQSQDKRQDASALLAPVYNWFTEGFDTADLQEAKGLLDELGAVEGKSP